MQPINQLSVQYKAEETVLLKTIGFKNDNRAAFEVSKMSKKEQCNIKIVKKHSHVSEKVSECNARNGYEITTTEFTIGKELSDYNHTHT